MGCVDGPQGPSSSAHDICRSWSASASRATRWTMRRTITACAASPRRSSTVSIAWWPASASAARPLRTTPTTCRKSPNWLRKPRARSLGRWLEMDETKLYSWFLGPKAENADLLERLVLEALRDCVFWRRNFHPFNDTTTTEKVKREDAFQDSLALVRQEFLTLLANLKRDVPFYSPRYIGHMLGDQLLPAIAAYFAAMLHNPNNVTLEASPITTRYEMEVARQLAR